MCNNNRNLSLQPFVLHFLSQNGHQDLANKLKNREATKAKGNISPKQAESALFQYSLKHCGRSGPLISLFKDSAADTIDRTIDHISATYYQAFNDPPDNSTPPSLLEADTLLTALQALSDALSYNCAVLSAWQELAYSNAPCPPPSVSNPSGASASCCSGAASYSQRRIQKCNKNA